jgi:hypothetical protein
VVIPQRQDRLEMRSLPSAGETELIRRVFMVLVGDNVWRVYEVNLGANPEWTGNVNNLRFDLPEGIGGHHEIDYI